MFELHDQLVLGSSITIPLVLPVNHKMQTKIVNISIVLALSGGQHDEKFHNSNIKELAIHFAFVSFIYHCYRLLWMGPGLWYIEKEQIAPLLFVYQNNKDSNIGIKIMKQTTINVTQDS